MIKAISILALLGTVAGFGWDLRKAPLPSDREKIMAKGWTASRDALGTALVTVYQPGGPVRPGSTGVRTYRAWMFLWKWCEVLSRNQRLEAGRLLARHLTLAPQDNRIIFFGPGDDRHFDHNPPPLEEVNQVLSDQNTGAQLLRQLLPADLADAPDKAIAERLDPRVIAEWINDEELSRLLFENLSDYDYSPGVLTRLQEVYLRDRQKFKEYRGLAVALALVYDQSFPRFWPHRQVEPQWVPVTELPVAERFAFWVESNESGALLLDLRKLSPDNIKLVVDAPLPASEFAWARKNVRYQRSEFAKAFDAVTYSSERIKSGNFQWKSGEYTLQNIYHQEGICVDQAYYASIAGKARGLPTLFFTGQGADGGHAWFGYLKSSDTWELDCGRYKNQHYVIGHALDPQTWRRISDHELETHRQGRRKGLEFFSSQDDILIGEMSERSGDGAKALKAYESAIQVCPQNRAGWNAKAAYLWRIRAPLNVLKSHYETALRQFTTDLDMRVEQQKALAQLARQQGAFEEAERLEQQIVAQNKRKRSDLSVGVAVQKMISLVAAKQFDDAFAEYRRQVASLGKFGGGNFFYGIVQPFAEALLERGDARHAKEVLMLARKALKPEAGSIIDNELKVLERLAADRYKG